MSRTNTNGDSARTVRTRGGYDAYFTQQAESPVSMAGQADAPAPVSDPDQVGTHQIERPWPGRAQQPAAQPGEASVQQGPEAAEQSPAAQSGEMPGGPGAAASDPSGRHDPGSGRISVDPAQLGSASGPYGPVDARPDYGAAAPGSEHASAAHDSPFTLLHEVSPVSRQASAAIGQASAPPAATAQPGEATAQPSEAQAHRPAATLARRDTTTTGSHYVQTPYTQPEYAQPAGTQWPAGTSANPWGQGPAAYTAQPEVHRAEVMPTTLSSQDLLSQIAAMKQAKLRSSSGMRGALNKVGFNLGLSSAERQFEDRRARIRRQLSKTYQVAVLSVKGGVGRTTLTATLGSTFAHLRPDRVVAIDANPDFGDLATRTSRHPYGLTLRDLAYAQNLEAFSAVHSFTAINAADLAVVASPWTTESVEALSGPEFAAATEILRRHYNLMLVDCGTGVLTSATSTVMQSSDSAVVVTPATVGGVKGAVATLNWLNTHGFTHLVENSIVAIVHQRPDKPIVEVAEIEKLFATVSRPTCVVPYDQHLAEGGEIDLRLVDAETTMIFEELAAALADNFPGFPDARHADLGGYR